MNKQTYFVLTYLFLFCGLTFFVGCGESEPPYPPKEISINSIDPPEFSDVGEKVSIKIDFSERPDSFSYSLRFHTDGDRRKCFGAEGFFSDDCFYINTELPEGKMNVIWEGDVAKLTFIEGEPIVAGGATLSIFYSAFSGYDDPKYSLTPSQKLEENGGFYTYTIWAKEPTIVTTRINPLTTKDGHPYVRVGQPFTLTVTFDKPAPGGQLIDFLWCDPGRDASGFGLVIGCIKMDTKPIYVLEQQGAVAIFNFPEGVSEVPDKSYNSFNVSIVWAGGNRKYNKEKRYWWKKDLGRILIW